MDFDSVLIDMDGVLTDFPSGVQKVHPQISPDMLVHDGGVYARVGMTPESFWAPMTEEWWAGLSPMEDAGEIFGILERKFGRQKLVICSSPARSPGCIPGKLRWLRQHLPEEYSRRQFIFTPIKHVISRPGVLLIDDTEKNYEEFCQPPGGRPGGSAFLLPRPWNSYKTWAGDAVSLLRKWLDRT